MTTLVMASCGKEKFRKKQMGKSIHVIFMTSSLCNLRCKYCFMLASRQTIRKFGIKDIEKAIRNCSNGFESVSFTWLGGEPLIVGMDFYREVVRVEKTIASETGTKFRNGIQSNGSMVTDEWLDFLEANDFSLGMTLDAPPDVHGIQRGQDVEKVITICRNLKERNWGVGLLCVLTNLNVNRGKEIFDFYQQLGVESFGFLPLKEVPTDGSIRPPNDEELFGLYKTIFDLWAWQPNPFRVIEPLYSMMEGLLGHRPGGCHYSVPCLTSMITIDQEGNIVPCSSLVAPNLRVGHILDQPLIDALAGEKTSALKILRDEGRHKYCEGCEFLPACGGGCPAEIYWHSGRYDGENPTCGARKRIFTYIREQLQTKIVPKVPHCVVN